MVLSLDLTLRRGLNGTMTVDYVEKDDKIDRSGRIALQVRRGTKIKRLYRDLILHEIAK